MASERHYEDPDEAQAQAERAGRVLAWQVSLKRIFLYLAVAIGLLAASRYLGPATMAGLWGVALLLWRIAIDFVDMGAWQDEVGWWLGLALYVTMVTGALTAMAEP